MVQVTKDPMGGKGARLTAQISLPGRYLVLAPDQDLSGISRRLPDAERKRLKTILKKVQPTGHGVIVRTAAEGAAEEAIVHDMKRLIALVGRHPEAGQEGEGPRGALRGARAHPARVPRPVHRRGVQGSRHRFPEHPRAGADLRARHRPRPRAEGQAAHAAGCPRSRSTASRSRSTRRSTARCGCRAAATWSSNGPRR